MKHTRNILLAFTLVPLALVAVAMLLFETGLLDSGLLAGADVGREFLAATVMEIVTIAFIPLALKLFKLRCVASRLVSAEALLKFGIVRLALIVVPMLVNTLLYYLYLNVAFGYLAIILGLCLFFVFPTEDRCYAEAGGPAGEDAEPGDEAAGGDGAGRAPDA